MSAWIKAQAIRVRDWAKVYVIVAKDWIITHKLWTATVIVAFWAGLML